MRRGLRGRAYPKPGGSTGAWAVAIFGPSPVATNADRFGATYARAAGAGRVMFLVANPRGLSVEEHPYLADLVRARIPALSVTVG
jgi:hypothetical protein